MKITFVLMSCLFLLYSCGNESSAPRFRSYTTPPENQNIQDNSTIDQSMVEKTDSHEIQIDEDLAIDHPIILDEDSIYILDKEVIPVPDNKQDTLDPKEDMGLLEYQIDSETSEAVNDSNNGSFNYICGDGVVDEDEICDPNYNLTLCSDVDDQFVQGYINCNSDCQSYNATKCYTAGYEPAYKLPFIYYGDSYTNTTEHAQCSITKSPAIGENKLEYIFQDAGMIITFTAITKHPFALSKPEWHNDNLYTWTSLEYYGEKKTVVDKAKINIDRANSNGTLEVSITILDLYISDNSRLDFNTIQFQCLLK